MIGYGRLRWLMTTDKNVLLDVQANELSNEAFITPDDISEIGAGCFNNVPIKKFTVSENLNVIQAYAFYNASLKSVKLSPGLHWIGAYAFFNNNLPAIAIPKKVTKIAAGMLQNNQLQSIEMSDEVTKIADCALANNNFTSFHFPKKLRLLGDFALAGNQLTMVWMPDSLEQVGRGALASNLIEQIRFSPNLEQISDHLLSNNRLRAVSFPNKINYIGVKAVYGNFLEQVAMTDSVRKIADYALADNYISNLILSQNLKEIGEGALENNRIKTLNLPNSLEKIGDYAFANNLIAKAIINQDCQLGRGVFDNCPLLNELRIYDWHLLNLNGVARCNFANNEILLQHDKGRQYSYIDQFEQEENLSVARMNELFPQTEEINQTFKIDLLFQWKRLFTSKKGVIDEGILRKIPEEILLLLPPIRENANYIKQGLKNYQALKTKFGCHNEVVYKDLFRMCFSLGLFDGDKAYAKAVYNYLNESISKQTLTPEFLYSGFHEIDLSKSYGRDKARLLQKALGDEYFANTNYLARIFNEYDEIKAFLRKEYDEIIGKNLHAPLKKALGDNSQRSELLWEKLVLNSAKKKPMLADVKYYLENNTYVIRDHNKALAKIIPHLQHVSQSDFDKLQDYYELAKDSWKAIITTADQVLNDYTYEWLAPDNPDNLMLGYLVKCCAKINSTAEDVMVQAMINPYIQNLVLRDENGQIVAKATGYYNKTSNYLLFNNIEAHDQFDRAAAKKAFFRAVDDQVAAYLAEGEALEQVRVGMTKNDLLTDEDLLVEHDDLLENYDYEYYGGEANSDLSGQAILYQAPSKQKKLTK